jgi:hypothetical protein
MDIDALYAGFYSTLPAQLRVLASELPCNLGLCLPRSVPCNQIGSHDVRLAAPALLGDALCAGRAAVRQATLSHVLAVVHACTLESLVRGRLSQSAQLDVVLEELASARNVALGLLVGPEKANDLCASAEARLRAALADELQEQCCPASFERYLGLSLDKHRIRLVGACALAESDAGPELATLVQRMLAGIALGLQLESDVVGWQDEFERTGGAWALSLARAQRQARPLRERITEPSPMVALVHGSGVLAYMMNESDRQLAAAATVARTIGARRLGMWAEQRAARAFQLSGGEQKTPGYTRRARSVVPCASEQVMGTTCRRGRGDVELARRA